MVIHSVNIDSILGNNSTVYEYLRAIEIYRKDIRMAPIVKSFLTNMIQLNLKILKIELFKGEHRRVSHKMSRAMLASVEWVCM